MSLHQASESDSPELPVLAGARSGGTEMTGGAGTDVGVGDGDDQGIIFFQKGDLVGAGPGRGAGFDRRQVGFGR